MLLEHTNASGEGIIVLSKLNIQIKDGHNLDDKLIEDISTNVKKIYFPVYDHESFLVWQDIPVIRFYTTVNIEDKEAFERRAYHWACDMIHQDLFLIPDLLIIESDTSYEGSFYLLRYTKGGVFAGDTWHENLEYAKGQAEFEYGESLGKWEEIPSDVTDPLKYVLDLPNKN